MIEQKKMTLPLIPLRGLVVFPYMVLHFDVGRKKSIKALEEALAGDQLVFLSTQLEDQVEEPGIDDVFSIGTIAKVKQILKMPGEIVRVLVEGISRGEIIRLEEGEFTSARILEYLPQQADMEDLEVEALVRKAQEICDKYFSASNKLPPEAIATIMTVDDPGRMCDIIIANIMLPVRDKQAILECLDPKERLNQLIHILSREIELLEVEQDISAKVKNALDKQQKEYYLREQMRVIQNELGDNGVNEEIIEYKEKFKKLGLSEEGMKKVDKELDRLMKTPPGMGEGTMIRNYLDWVADLPWNVETEESLDLAKAEKILNEDHYGLEQIKDRILEYLAVKKLSNNLKGPILCFVGPPGVGKTSIVRSIAKAMNRNYVRISLGGVKDEAEIRGHRRTYLGSMPGRIINALKQAKSKNPVMLFDEIDKMSNDYRGDPASAMLEVLDGEQNNTFRDHFLELPFDLSDVLFVTTANKLDTIPRPLLDRMEIIELSGYIEEEKFNIAKKFLFPKQMKMYGLSKGVLKVTDSAVHDVINYYTREAGVRSLEREIGSLCRKAARKIVSEKKKAVSITEKNLEKYLGARRFSYDIAENKETVGVATGLAWTAVGGDTLSIEVNVMKGSGAIELTGHLGDVMKESARAAISYIRTKTAEYKIAPDFYKNADIHIHVPEGATPKDGPSAGITIATAVVSALSGYPVRGDVAMTGEITLRGRVLPIGGLKEKSIAAFRAGIRTVIIPKDNVKDLEELPENIRGQIRFVPVSIMDEVLDTALGKIPVYSEFSMKPQQDYPITANPMEFHNELQR